MSGGQFQAGLREVINSERIFSCRALIKPDINFWKEVLTADKDTFEGKKLCKNLDEKSNIIMECCFYNARAEFFTTIARCIAKRFSKESKCKIYLEKLKGDSEASLLHKEYFKRLSSGG